MSTEYGDFRVQFGARAAGTVSVARGRGAAASVSADASELAASVLRDGGNAFDAAFSLAFALCVYHPQAGNLGGGGYLVYKERGARPYAYNYREQLPAGAKRQAFLQADGSPDPDKTAFGPSSVCVPGTVKAFFTLQRRHGKLRARDLLTAIAKRAEAGAVVTQYEADCLNRLSPKLAASPESRRFYVKAEPFVAGDILRNAHLAQTLNVLAQEGEAAFYRGRIAELIVNDLGAHGGFISASDLAGYTIREVEPIAVELQGRQVWTVPPEAGGAILINILSILNHCRIADHQPGTSAYCHLLAEAAKIAFINRLDYLGDVPLADNATYQSLVTHQSSAKLAALIDPHKATAADALASRVRQAQPQLTGTAGVNTTHFSVIDAEGNAVSSSYTMNLRYGSKWSIEGAGFLVNGSVDSFSFVPGKENYFGITGNQANLFAPGKRPASNMAPVLVTDGAAVEMVVGTPGGPMIPTVLASILVSTLVHHQPLAESIAAARFHHQAWPDVLYTEAELAGPQLIAELGAMGHKVKDKGEPMGDVHGVMRVGDELLAASDSRRQGKAAAHD